MTSINRQHHLQLSQVNVPWREHEEIEGDSNTHTSETSSMAARKDEIKINKKLEFDLSDGYDEDDEEDQVAVHDSMVPIKSKQSVVRSSDGGIRKRIDFGSSEDEVLDADNDPLPIRNLDFYSDSEEDSERGYHPKKQAISSVVQSRAASILDDMSSDHKESIHIAPVLQRAHHQLAGSGDHIKNHMLHEGHENEIFPSPHRTRSGRIYFPELDVKSSVNKCCHNCKPDTQSSIISSEMSSKHAKYHAMASAKRPFSEASTPFKQYEFETTTQPLGSGENLHLNLLQNDLVSRKVNIKRSRRHSCGQSEASISTANIDATNALDSNSDPALAPPTHQEQPPFELPPPTLDAPPPLNYNKRPISRLSLIREMMQQRKKDEQLSIRTDLQPRQHDRKIDKNDLLGLRTPSFEGGEFIASPGFICQTPTNQHSPPTNEVRAMRIFDSHSPIGHRVFTSAASAPKFRIAFDVVGDDKDIESKGNGHQRRVSAPAGVKMPSDYKYGGGGDAPSGEPARKSRKRSANVNPFTPTPTLESIKRRRKSGGSSIIQTPNNLSINGSSIESCGSCSVPPCLANTSASSCTTSVSFTTPDGDACRRDENTVNLPHMRISTGADNPGTQTNIITSAAGNNSAIDNTFQSPHESHILARRLKVSDINISRYDEEFVEIEEIASGVFGKVMVARHRLDGMVYAIKITKNQIFGNTHQERVTMNEVFAHSALIKHKHIVRYYNSWVENGRVYIQNEFCEGGSLGSRINDLRKENHQNIGNPKRFSECELKRILLHVAKGLHCIHSKGLVHLDIKPENIFVALEHASNSPSPNTQEACDFDDVSIPMSQDVHVSERKLRPPVNLAQSNIQQPSTKNLAGANNIGTERERNRSGHESTDSGNGSGCDASSSIITSHPQSHSHGLISHPQCNGIHREISSSSPGTPESLGCPYFAGVDRISYKIGDLGHVVPIRGDYNPEEGDCRYMAPELLWDDINRDRLPKADIFSLGLTLYEAASLRVLPKNSLEDPSYEDIKSGNIPLIEGYSREFNTLIKSMINPDPMSRPNANRLATLVALRNGANSKSRSQLYTELREARAKLKLLEQELQNEKNAVLAAQTASASPEFPTPPKDKEVSSPVSISSTPPSSTNEQTVTTVTNFYPCKTRSRDALKMVPPTNTSPIGSKNNVTTPNRVGKRSNLRKRALMGKSKTAAPVPPAKKDLEKFASTATRSNLASSGSHQESRLKSMY